MKEKNHRPQLASLMLKAHENTLDLIPDLTAVSAFPRNRLHQPSWNFLVNTIEVICGPSSSHPMERRGNLQDKSSSPQRCPSPHIILFLATLPVAYPSPSKNRPFFTTLWGVLVVATWVSADSWITPIRTSNVLIWILPFNKHITVRQCLQPILLCWELRTLLMP